MASPLAWSFVQRHPRPVEMEILEMDVNCSATKKWRYWKWMSTAVPRRNGDTGNGCQLQCHEEMEILASWTNIMLLHWNMLEQ